MLSLQAHKETDTTHGCMTMVCDTIKARRTCCVDATAVTSCSRVRLVRQGQQLPVAHPGCSPSASGGWRLQAQAQDRHSSVMASGPRHGQWSCQWTTGDSCAVLTGSPSRRRQLNITQLTASCAVRNTLQQFGRQCHIRHSVAGWYHDKPGHQAEGIAL